MNIFGKTISVLFALTFLGALGLGGYFSIEYIVALFLGMGIQVARVTAIASVVVLLAASLIASGIRQASKQNRTNQFHTDKAATYKLFIGTWTGLLRERAGRENRSAIELAAAFQALDQLLALHGSPAVIKAHAALRALAAESGTQNPEIRLQFSRALLEVRKDLGSDTRGLTAEALQGFILPGAGELNVSDKRSEAVLHTGMT